MNRATAVGLIAGLATLAVMAVHESSPLVRAALTARTGPRNAAAAHLLADLHDCAQEIPHAGAAAVTARCITTDLDGLAGISRARLAAALGPPRLCLPGGGGPTPDGAPPDGAPPDGTPSVGSIPAASCHRPAWSFYYLPPHLRGGGPELVCETSDGRTCRSVGWVATD